jgi:hypothetical protein
MDILSQANRSAIPTGNRTNNANERDPSTKANSTAANSTFAAIQEEKRQRTLVLRNAPESDDATPSRRQEADELRTKLILDALQVQVRPIAVFRLGKAAPNKPRFLMAELPTRSHLVEALRNGRLLVKSAFKEIYVGKSMTAEERRQWSAQRKTRNPTSGQASPPSPSQHSRQVTPPQPLQSVFQPDVTLQIPPASSSATTETDTDVDTPPTMAALEMDVITTMKNTVIRQATDLLNGRAKFFKNHPNFKPRPPQMGAKLNIAKLNALTSLTSGIEAMTLIGAYQVKLSKWCDQHKIGHDEIFSDCQ